jgi:hypothetical protein
MGDKQFTWAELMYGKLGAVKVYTIYFPSRFDLSVDEQVMVSLKSFGKNTGVDTIVNSWDTTDPALQEAMALFEIGALPSLVLATGLKLDDIEPYGPDKANLYTIVIKNNDVLTTPARLASAVNAAHQVLIRCNPKEITGYIRKQSAKALLQSVGKVAGELRDELMKFKPKFQLPGGVSLEIG